MFAIVIDRADHRRKGHAPLAGDLLQTVPELVFNADTGLVARNHDGALQNRRHGFPTTNERRYYIDRTAIRTRKTPGLVATEGYRSVAAAVWVYEF